MIYLDNQASTPVDPRVLEAMRPLWTESFGNPHSSEHFAGWIAMEAVESAADRIASAMGALASEVVFTSGATEANNLALQGAVLGRSDPRRSRIIVSAIEHKSVLDVACWSGKHAGVEVVVAPVDGVGRIDLDQLESLLSSEILLVSVGAINGEIGTIQPVSEVSKMARSVGALVHSDATQAACVESLNEIFQSCDLVSLSAHKCYGPKGVGALVVRGDTRAQIAPLMFGGGQQGGLRPGTIPSALAVGFANALELAQGALAEEVPKIRALRDRLAAALIDKCAGTSIVGPNVARHPGNLNVRFEGASAKSVLAAMQPRVAASTGSACSSGVEAPSHVLTAIGYSWDAASECVRFSTGRFNSTADIDHASNIIAETVADSRVMEPLS